MKRWMWLALAAIIVVGAGVSLVALPAEPEWTTSSPEAMAEFEAAMVAGRKLYLEDERRHLQRALELDPNFALARLWTLDSKFREDEEAAKAEWDEILATDTSKVTPRERFFIERSRLIREEKREEIGPLLDGYLADYPNDPYLVYEKADQHWKRDEFEEKKQSHKRKSETDDAFDGFGLHTNEDDEGPSFEEISLPKVQHRKWGDEIFEDQEMNADSYPSCEPERPAEMINELQCLGIEQ